MTKYVVFFTETGRMSGLFFESREAAAQCIAASGVNGYIEEVEITLTTEKGKSNAG